MHEAFPETLNIPQIYLNQVLPWHLEIKLGTFEFYSFVMKVYCALLEGFKGQRVLGESQLTRSLTQNFKICEILTLYGNKSVGALRLLLLMVWKKERIDGSLCFIS
jgi:energy-converting hydrogenase Eha subunit G